MPKGRENSPKIADFELGTKRGEKRDENQYHIFVRTFLTRLTIVNIFTPGRCKADKTAGPHDSLPDLELKTI